jgi:diguanylate cyclase
MGDPLVALTHEWLSGITKVGFVPGLRARTRAALQELLEELVAAVRAEPFDPSVGRRIGAELVDLRMSAPPVIGTTVRLLAARLPTVLDEPDPARVLALLDHLVTGFVTAQRNAAVNAAEQMNCSEKMHWRGVQHDLQQRLQHAVLHDPRTGLPNEQHLRTHLDALEAGASRVGFCLLGVDRFAELADTLGDDQATRLLAAIGQRLRLIAEPAGNFLAHVGDDQFAITIAGTCDADDVIKVAAEARNAMLLPFPLDGHALRVGITAGVVEAPAGGTSPGRWLRDGRLALRWARADQHDHAVFEPGRADADRRRHRLAAALPAAFDAGEFVAHYQPLHRLADGSVSGVEALARWQRPGVPEPLSPRHFITLAEHTGMIRPLGRMMLEAACRQGVAWRRAGHDLTIGVNLSPLQLTDTALAADVADILHRTGLPAAALQLEIVENAGWEQHYDTLRRLADVGVSLVLDDFGTGSSSLAALAWLPIRHVKLAAGFLTDLDARAAAEVVRHTIALCHALGATVTAQGVETPGQERMLRDLGCDQGQGGHFAQPAPGERLFTQQPAPRC